MKHSKSLLKGSLALVAIAVLLFNLTISKGTGKDASKNLKLSNISMLQASAGEYACSMATQACCSYPGMQSNGVLSYTY
jgi:hypothetical protein